MDSCWKGLLVAANLVVIEDSFRKPQTRISWIGDVV